MSDRDQPGACGPADPDRRLLLGGLAAAVGAATIGGADSAAEAAPRTVPVSDAALREAIETVVVVFAENRSFNNLFGDFPGVEQPLSKVSPERSAQRDRDGSVLKHLPPIWEGLVPHRQVVEHREYLIDEKDIAPLPNAPFALSTPDGDPLPHGLVTRDLIHAFYNNQLQINGGRNDGFVAWGDSGALVMGHYGDNSANLRLWQVARDFTLCDNFFMGAFGGSFLNHQYLIAARPPYYPNADRSPAKGRITCWKATTHAAYRPHRRS